MQNQIIRLTTPDIIESIRDALRKGDTCVGDFCAQMTRYEFVLAPKNDRVYVGVVDYGCYIFELGYIHAGYLESKLQLRNLADARNLTVFLNALGHDDGVHAYLSTIPLVDDHVDHDSPEADRV